MKTSGVRITQLVIWLVGATLLSFYGHELGHFLAGLALGYESMVLTPVAVRFPGPIAPQDGWIIALAGPVVSAILCAVAIAPARRTRTPMLQTVLSYFVLINGITCTLVLATAFLEGTDAHRFLSGFGTPAYVLSTVIGVASYLQLWRLVPDHEGGQKLRWLSFGVFAAVLLMGAVISGLYEILLLLAPATSLLMIGFVHPGTLEARVT